VRDFVNNLQGVSARNFMISRTSRKSSDQAGEWAWFVAAAYVRNITKRCWRGQTGGRSWTLAGGFQPV
ncbi:hypothetical protein, partial [Klebsiella quasipneumoniae]|uniref:hypothetical protein n=1 Tax=Klebsiella quasipneumoniae TaxID=1463165 RepID=UPI00272EE9CD